MGNGEPKDRSQWVTLYRSHACGSRAASQDFYGTADAFKWQSQETDREKFSHPRPLIA